MEEIRVKFDQLYVDEEYKKVFPKDRYENLYDLTESIKKNGLMLPLTVVQQSDGRYKVTSGIRRYHAIQQLSPDYNLFPDGIRVIVVDNETASLAGIIESQPRQEFSALDICIGIKVIHIKDGVPIEKIATMCGVTKRWVKQRLSVATMFEQLETRLKDFNPHLVQELKRRAGQVCNDSDDYIVFTHLYHLYHAYKNYNMDAMTTGHVSDVLQKFLKEPTRYGMLSDMNRYKKAFNHDQVESLGDYLFNESCNEEARTSDVVGFLSAASAIYQSLGLADKMKHVDAVYDEFSDELEDYLTKLELIAEAAKAIEMPVSGVDYNKLSRPKIEA